MVQVDAGVSFSVLSCAVLGFLCWRGWRTFFDHDDDDDDGGDDGDDDGVVE